MKFNQLLVALALVLPASFFASTTQENLMLETLDTIKNTFQAQYAPMEWKKQQYNWDLESKIEEAKEQVILEAQNQTLSTVSFHKIVKKFFNSAKDYHVSAQFYSTEMSFLPFKIKGAEGRYFITWVDSKEAPELEVGDELIEFDNLPIHEVLQNLKKEEMLLSNEESDDGLAEILFSSRLGLLANNVHQGMVKVKIRSKETNALSTHSISWIYSAEQIASRALKPSLPLEDTAVSILKELTYKPFELSFYPALKLAKSEFNEEEDENPHELGARKSFVPPLGKVIWQSKESSFFHAYLFEAYQRKVGYIRIAEYYGDEEELEEFSDLIKYMQKNSDALIIDQFNNPGGSAFYLYTLASMLTDKPLYLPKHKMSITQKDVMNSIMILPLFEAISSDEDAVELLGETFEGIPVTYKIAECFINYFNFIIDEWNAGKTITDPYPLCGIDCINPHPQSRYTKPLLILINGLDFSGGDFFPAILKDMKRATIFGSRTAGAGGYIASCEFPNLLGIAKYRFTGSIAERENKQPIENLGVEPDIVYKLTAEDLQNNFLPLKKEILSAVRTLLPKKIKRKG